MTRSSTTRGELAKPQLRNARVPAGHGWGPVAVGRRVARPHDGAVGGVERVQDSGRTEREDATVAEGRRPARAGARVRLEEPGPVAVGPHRRTGGRVVAGHDLVVAALLLGIDTVAMNREGRPARPDRPAPQLDRRGLGPVRLDSPAVNDAVAPGSAKAGPFGSRPKADRGADAVLTDGTMGSGAGLLGSRRGCFRSRCAGAGEAVRHRLRSEPGAVPRESSPNARRTPQRGRR